MALKIYSYDHRSIFQITNSDRFKFKIQFQFNAFDKLVPQRVKRPVSNRIFINRTVRMQNVHKLQATRHNTQIRNVEIPDRSQSTIQLRSSAPVQPTLHTNIIFANSVTFSNTFGCIRIFSAVPIYHSYNKLSFFTHIIKYIFGQEISDQIILFHFYDR